MAAKKKTAPKKEDWIPFDELPRAVKMNRRNLYEYMRTGELPNEE